MDTEAMVQQALMDVPTLLQRLGGVPKVAQLCDCTEQAVYRWRRIKRIPKARVQYLRQVRPDAWATNPITTKEAS